MPDFCAHAGMTDDTAAQQALDAVLAGWNVLAQGYACFALVLADGRHTRAVLRATLTLVRRAGIWRVQQHHLSTAPEAPPLGD